MPASYDLTKYVAGYALTIAIAFSAGGAIAQDATTSATSDARFQIERDGDGFVRLDKKNR